MHIKKDFSKVATREDPYNSHSNNNRSSLIVMIFYLPFFTNVVFQKLIHFVGEFAIKKAFSPLNQSISEILHFHQSFVNICNRILLVC